MPTFGWVREDALEAFLSGIESTPERSAPQRPQFTCPFCRSIFSTPRQLQEHVGSSHNIARPFLLIEGTEPSREYTQRATLLAKQFACVNTTSASLSVNGSVDSSVDPKEIPAILAQLDFAEVVLTLQNDARGLQLSARTNYRISFCVPETHLLSDVERAFEQFALGAELTTGTISLFLADARCQGKGQGCSVLITKRRA